MDTTTTVLAVARGYVNRKFNSQRRPPPRGAQPRRFGATNPRAATPPRDPKDNKCANCNQPGHTKFDCPKPPISIEDRKCYICGKAGHIARKCRDKDKGGRPPARPALMAQPCADTAIVPYRNRIFLGVVTDEEGYQQPRRPQPKGVTFGELPVTHREASQRLRKASKFAPLIDYDDDDDYDTLYPHIDSAVPASPVPASSSSLAHEVSQPEEDR